MHGKCWSLSPQMPAVEEEKLAPAPLVKSSNPSVVFCDSNSFCPDGTTCCRFSFSQWTCCIYVLVGIFSVNRD